MTTTAVSEGRAHAPATRSPRPPRRREKIGIVFVLPFLVVFGLFLIWPTLYGFWLSFTDRNLAGAAGAAWVGLDNYVEALTDGMVWHSLGNTVWFTVLTTIPLVVIPLALALLANSKVKGQWFWRLAIFMPFLLASTVVSKFFGWLFNPDLGLINAALGTIGITGPAWLQQPDTAMWAIAITTVWWTAGFNFLLYLAALQGIPQQVYEAASVDGAGRWRTLVSITLPLMGRITALIIALQILASVKVFDQIYQMTAGGPADATRSILMYVYDVGFSEYRLGFASAISYIFFAIILVLSLAQLKIVPRRAES